MKTSIKKIITRGIVLFSVLAIALVAANVRGEDPGITFATGGLEFKIDSHAFYNGNPVPGLTWDFKNLVPTADHFFNFNDIKPGDYGRTIISAHIKKSPAWACLDFKNLTNNENGLNEPEALVDSNGTSTGELAQGMEFFAWFDDGDNIFEVGEKPLFGTTTQSAINVLNNTTYALVDYKHGPAWQDGSSHYIGIAWCAGDLSVNLATAQITCDGVALGNSAQTDSMSVDVTLRAVPSQQDPKFTCVGENKPPKDEDGGSCHPWDPPHNDSDNDHGDKDKNSHGGNEGNNNNGGDKNNNDDKNKGSHNDSSKDDSDNKGLSDNHSGLSQSNSNKGDDKKFPNGKNR